MFVRCCNLCDLILFPEKDKTVILLKSCRIGITVQNHSDWARYTKMRLTINFVGKIQGSTLDYKYLFLTTQTTIEHTWSTIIEARSLKISFKSWMERTICEISFSRCWINSVLSSTCIICCCVKPWGKNCDIQVRTLNNCTYKECSLTVAHHTMRLRNMRVINLIFYFGDLPYHTRHPVHPLRTHHQDQRQNTV